MITEYAEEQRARTRGKRPALNRRQSFRKQVRAGSSYTSNPNTAIFSVKSKTRPSAMSKSLGKFGVAAIENWN